MNEKFFEGSADIPRELLHDARLSGYAKLTYLALSSFKNARNQCWPSHESIAQIVQCSKRRVASALVELKEAGVIWWERRDKESGGQSSNLYTLGSLVQGPHAAGAGGGMHQVQGPHAPGADERYPIERSSIGTYSSSEVAGATTRPDVESLLDLLDAEIAANGGRVPSRTKRNRDAIRLMLDRDGISFDDVAGAIRWAQRSEFWRSNILSAAKLREKYDTLRLQAQRSQKSSVTAFDRGMALADALEAREREAIHA